MKRDEFLQVIRSPFHFATCDAVLRGCKIVDISKPPQWRRMSKKVRSPLDPLCEGTPPAGGGGENCTAARNISGYGKVLSLRPFGAPLPLWRKRHLSRIGGVCLAEGGFSTRCASPTGESFLIFASEASTPPCCCRACRCIRRAGSRQGPQRRGPRQEPGLRFQTRPRHTRRPWAGRGPRS